LTEIDAGNQLATRFIIPCLQQLRHDVKRAVWKQAKHPETGGAGWLIVGVLLVLAVLKAIFFL
jgi:hypothetical protein